MKNLECLGCRNKLKLWIIERKAYAPLEYDTYSEAIVAAETEEDARHIHPNSKATLIGIAASNIERGVILSSFHAG